MAIRAQTVQQYDRQLCLVALSSNLQTWLRRAFLSIHDLDRSHCRTGDNLLLSKTNKNAFPETVSSSRQG